jgi:hypothetical protein
MATPITPSKKKINVLHVLGIFSLLCWVATSFVSYPEPPGLQALSRTPATLVIAQPGPVSFPGHRGPTWLGNKPGDWVFAIELEYGEERFVINPPDGPRRRSFERLEKGMPVAALIQGEELWQLENIDGDVLADYGHFATNARWQIDSHRRTQWLFVGVGILLLIAGQAFAGLVRRIAYTFARWSRR